MSSSTVTRWTAHCAERISVMIAPAWLRMGPAFASPTTSSLTLRKRPIRPVGGASSTTASYTGPSAVPFRAFAWRPPPGDGRGPRRRTAS
jgi:hypothetical protein